MTFQTKLQTLNLLNSPLTDRCPINWNTLKVYQASAINNKMARVAIQGGVLEFSQAVPNLTASINSFTYGLDYSDNLYFQWPQGNSCGVEQVSGANGALLGQWGSSSGFGNLPNGIPQYIEYVPFPTPPARYGPMLAIGAGPSFYSHSYMNGPVFNGTNFVWPDTSGTGCPGPAGSGLCYVLTYSAPDPTVMHLYKCTAGYGMWSPSDWPTQNLGNVTLLLGTLAPTDLDAGWTAFTTQGICTDSADGNLIGKFAKATGTGGAAYIAKLSKADASVIWKVPVGALTDSSPHQTGWGRCRNGHFAYLVTGGTNTVYDIVTSTGAYTSYTSGLAGLSINNQCYDDTTGLIICEGSFSQAAGSPTLLDSTPAIFSGWMALYATPGYSPVQFGPQAKRYARIFGNYR